MTTLPVHLHHVWDYTQVDRDFWDRHLEGFIPKDLVDAHTHVTAPDSRLHPMTDQMKKQYWVGEVAEPISLDDELRVTDLVWPGRRIRKVCFGWPDLDFDLEASNRYLAEECPKEDWWNLALVRPTWSRQQIEAQLLHPRTVGFKPYYALIEHTPHSRDVHQEASIYDFLTPLLLEIANDRGLWVTLHVPKADRLGHPSNIKEIRQIREKYPAIKLMLAHLGRCYTKEHACEALPLLADDPGLFFDNSAVLNPDVHRFALETLGPQRILYGSDNPVFYMRGRRQWHGRSYVNRTSYPFHFNRNREAPETEACYTLYMYEALNAIRIACSDLRLTPQDVRDLFCGNALRLLDEITSMNAP